MQRRNIRYSLALVFLLSSNVWALGLGEIRIDSALNAPLRAEIELLAASPEELDNLQVALASQETFERYGLDRPFFLQSLRFEIVRSGAAEGNYVSITSTNPITEPFLTFLVEATWSRGRLLREYTVLLDPPTFAPPAAADTRPAVTAPERSTPTDSAPIDRPAPRTEPMASEPEPAPARPIPAPPTRTEPVAEQPAYEEPADEQPPRTSPPPVQFDGTEVQVARGQTLWGIAAEIRPDFNMTMNQTMLAIYEANPEAFGGNINFLRAGATLRIPGADAIYNIDRAYALQEAQRQHAAWDGTPAPAPAPTTAFEEPAEPDTRPSLQLVPPDEDLLGVGTGDAGAADADPVEAREQEILDRIAELEAADVPQQRSLIEIRDNELSTLREELARIRGEVYEPPIEDDMAPDDVMVDDTEAGELFPDLDDQAADDAAADDAVADEADTEPAPQIISRPAQQEPGIVDQILGVLSNTWLWIIGGVVLVAAGIGAWFVRRSREDDDDLESWTDAQGAAPDLGDTMMSATESLGAPAHDESIVVVEQGAGVRPLEDDTLDAPAIDATDTGETVQVAAATGQFDSLEDTFSSDTAVNLDQSDPIAEADFHMAYGLYDQAADLVNGALELEPERLDLLTKLCEIYFVWGNRDAFIDAAQRVKLAVGDGGSADWDKIVIMGQQIAADHELFAGAGVAGATKAVDLSFEAEMDEASELDMDFGAAGGEGDEVIDLGLAVEDDNEVIDLGSSSEAPLEASSVDFVMEDDEETGEMAAAPEEDFGGIEESATIEASADDATAEMMSEEPVVESPTIEDQFDALDSTSELPSISDPVDEAIAGSGQGSDATAEINLDELGLDLDALEDTGTEAIDDLAETELATLDEMDETGLARVDDDPLSITSSQEALQDTSLNEMLSDPVEDTARNPEVDPDQTGSLQGLSADDTGLLESLDIDDPLSATGAMRLAADETGQNPLMQQVLEEETEFDDSLLEATGRTQILPEDFAVDTGVEETAVITDDAETLLATLDDDDTEAEAMSDEDATMLAPAMGDDSDFDFAKTEALPKDMFTGNMDLDETGEMPAVASTDVDLDLDDLTAALKVSEMGDTVDMPRDDATVEHVRPNIPADDDSVAVPTMSLSQDEMSEDLMEARTMTEVGTKLDLARAYVDMGDPGGARSILEEVLDEGDEGQRQQAQQLLDTLAG
jgi:pilus assembly protein FimV